jgi:pyruvate ferredoxin oxidoreductase beta subunit
MAHEIPYVATATVADLRDLEAKVTRAMSMRGARYIHVMVPCPLGWGTASCDTIKIARLATQSGLFRSSRPNTARSWPPTPIRRQVPVEDYLKGQKRFAHLFNPVRRDEVIDRLQAQADRNIRRYGLLPEATSPTLPPIAEEANA